MVMTNREQRARVTQLFERLNQEREGEELSEELVVKVLASHEMWGLSEVDLFYEAAERGQVRDALVLARMAVGMLDEAMKEGRMRQIRLQTVQVQRDLIVRRADEIAREML